MTRLSFYVFFGEMKTKAQQEPPPLNMVLLILAFLSIGAGALGVPHLISEFLPFHPPHLLHTALKSFSPVSFKGPLWQEALIMLFSTTAGLSVAAFTFFCYAQNKVFSFWTPAQKTLESAFYIPFLIENYIQPAFKKSCHHIFKLGELQFFNQSAPFLSLQVLNLKKVFSQFQNSNLQSYALYFTLGLTLMILLIFAA